MVKKKRKSKRKKVIKGESVSGHVRNMADGTPVKVKGYKRKLIKGKIRSIKKKYKANYLKEYTRDTGTGRFV